MSLKVTQRRSSNGSDKRQKDTLRSLGYESREVPLVEGVSSTAIRRLASDGLLTPRHLGDAARTGDHDLQHLKMLWHTLARFGAPEGAGTARSDGVRAAG